MFTMSDEKRAERLQRPQTSDPTYGERRLRFARAAERYAAAYLERRAWRVLAMNQRVARGEIDIIARRAGVLAFVEVKARRTRSAGAPEDAVTPRKQRQIARLAEMWMGARPGIMRGVTDVRFDIIAVDLSCSPPQLRHLPAAFDGGH
jgi:putative endonuclease